MERIARLRFLATALAVVLPAAAAWLPAGGAAPFGLIAAALVPRAHAAVYATRDQALDEAFPNARIEKRRFVLDDDQVQKVSQHARVKLPSKLVTAHLAWHGDSLAGAAFIDSRNVRTMPGVFMVVIAPDSTIGRVEVLAFHEPPDYLPPRRWLDLMGERPLDDQLWPGRDLHHLSGATLTARAVTEIVRSALALYEHVVAPSLTATVRAAEETE